MAALLIVAHAPLASALRQAASHIDVGPARVEAVDVDANATPEQVEAALRGVLAQIGGETLVLADIANATPCNGAQRLLGDPALRVRLIAGVNLPMLWRALCYRDLPLDELLRRAIDGATMGVLHLASSRQQQQAPKVAAADDPLAHHDQQ